MKRCATGLSARFFNVMIPIGLRAVANSIGKALGAGFLLANANTEAGRIERNRPLATKVQRAGVEEVMIVASGTPSRAARKASRTIDPVRLSAGGRTHGSLIKSASRIPRRLLQGLVAPAATT